MTKMNVLFPAGMRSRPAVKTGAVMLAISLVLGAIVLSAKEPSADAGPTTFPARILIIRHAEKPADDESDDLSPQGFQRAKALPQLFEKSDARPKPFPKPDFIFAAAKSKHSNRSVDTVTPLAKELGLTINSTYRDEDFAKVANELFGKKKYAGKTILICWHHGKIVELAHALKASNVPDKWKSDIFDRVWQIEYDADGKASFRERPESLLESDASEKERSKARLPKRETSWSR